MYVGTTSMVTDYRLGAYSVLLLKLRARVVQSFMYARSFQTKLGHILNVYDQSKIYAEFVT